MTLSWHSQIVKLPKDAQKLTIHYEEVKREVTVQWATEKSYGKNKDDFMEMEE